MDIKEKWLRKKAEILLPFLKKIKVPAEFLTVFRIFFALIVVIIFLNGNYLLSLIFLTVYQFVLMLDYIDGKLARYQRRFSVKWVKIDFIQMDIKGAEIWAIKGMERTMKNNHVHFAIAAYHTPKFLKGKKTADVLLPIFKKKNYSAKIGFPKHLTVYASKNI